MPPAIDLPRYIATIVISTLFAFCSARVLFTVLSMIFAGDALAQEKPLPVIALNQFDFWISVALGVAGGIVSFWHESKLVEWRRERLLASVIGHVTTSMFAAVLAYLLSIYMQIPEVLAWLASAMFGFGGMPVLNALMKWVLRRFGIEEPQPVAPPTVWPPQ